jgi:Zn-dependent M28 family amino/carboxypeptidase
LLELGRAVERARLERDVKALARVRTPGSVGWKHVQRVLSDRLSSLGFDVEQQVYATGLNVIGTLKGEHSDQVLISAHYDHIARCAGADDDGSGLAAALELGRLLAPHRHVQTLVIAFWDEEERGLLGSRAFAERARAQRLPITVALSFDAVSVASDRERSQRTPEGFASLLPEQAALLAGRGSRADFVAVVANPSAHAPAQRLLAYAAPLELRTMYLEVPLLQAALMPDLFRSDHASFWLAGYPGLLLTDTAELRNPRYHCQRGSDSPESLDYGFLSRVTGAALAATADLLDPH